MEFDNSKNCYRILKSSRIFNKKPELTKCCSLGSHAKFLQKSKSDSNTGFEIVKIKKEVGPLSQYVCQLINPYLIPPVVWLF